MQADQAGDDEAGVIERMTFDLHDVVQAPLTVKLGGFVALPTNPPPRKGWG